MARSLWCQAVAAAAGIARVPVVAARVSLELASVPPTVAARGISAVLESGREAADKVDKTLRDVGSKCSL